MLSDAGRQLHTGRKRGLREVVAGLAADSAPLGGWSESVRHGIKDDAVACFEQG